MLYSCASGLTELRITNYEVEKMNAIDGAIERMDRVSYGLFEQHLTKCYQTGGIVVLSPRLVFLGAAWDPVEGDDEHTIAVMYVHGDAEGKLTDVLELGRRQGFTHVVWCRQVSRGDSSLRKVSLERFERVWRGVYGK